tara:strand:- start:404 stop:568 length:165 start_codon:yes stop_codon:yes gene_type:complete
MKQYLIKNSLGVFFIGFFITFLEDVIASKYVFSVLGGIVMLLSFYLMNLKSKQK